MRRAARALGLVAYWLAASLGLLVATELALRLTGLGTGAPAYDPFAGFASGVKLFVPATRPDGVAIFRVSAARLQASEPTSSEREFLAEKPAGGFRVFVLGGSTAAGFPYPPAYGPGAWLERRLRAALPGRPIEVVNAALPGYGSRRVLLVAREVAAYGPDLLVVSCGHNEWAERRYYSHLIEMDRRLFRLRERLLTTRLFTLLSHVSRLWRSDAGSLRGLVASERREFGEMFAVLSRRAAGQGYATPQEIRQRDALYRANLEEIVRAGRGAGAHVALLTLVQNLADWAPGASAHRPDLAPAAERRWDELVARGDRAAEAGDCASALDLWNRALAVDDDYAALHHRVADCHRLRGEIAPARRHYRLASDLDRVPHGAPSYFDDVIREVARTGGALVVETEAALREASSDGLVGAEFFNEFVHPNLRGYQRIGAAIASALREAGIPEAPERWAELGAADPTPEELIAAHPELRIREHLARRNVCAVARRPRCVEESARALAALGVEVGAPSTDEP